MNKQFALLYSYLHGMWRYRWAALIIAWIVALVGWLIMFSVPDQFSVKAVVHVDTSSVLKPLLAGLTPETDAQDELKIMTRVLLSRSNLMSIIRETDMDLDINTVEEKEALLKQVAKSIKIIGGVGKKKDNVYEISYQSNSPNNAYQVVLNLLNTLIEDTLKSSRTDTVAAQKFLNLQISDYEKKLSLAEQKLARFKKENLGLMPTEQGNYYKRLQGAKDSIEATSSELNLANRRYSELLRQLKGESQVLSSERFQSANAKKIKEYQLQLDSLLELYTERHPKVNKLRVIIEHLKENKASPSDTYNDVREEFNPIYQEIKVELSKARVEIETLKIQLEERKIAANKLGASIDIMPEVEAKLAKLNRGYEVTRTRYLDLVGRSESAHLAQNIGNSSNDITFRVIEPPLVPVKPSGPNRALFSIGALLAALATGFAWSFLRNMLQPTFNDFTQLVSATGFPVLGSVNLYLSPEHQKRRRIQVSFFLSATFLLIILFGAVFLSRDWGSALFASVIMEK